MIDKLTEDLFHIDLAIGDAEVELEDIEGVEAAIECLKIARHYIADIKKDMLSNKDTKAQKRCKNCKYRMDAEFKDSNLVRDPNSEVWCTHRMRMRGNTCYLRRKGQVGCKFFEPGDAVNREEWQSENIK